MDPLSAGIGAAGSLLGGFFTHNYNRWMLRQQMKYNTAEREASQDWQNQQREAQNQFSEDMYNKYSSPQALVAQYQAAGLNPRLAVEGGQVGSVQASSGSSGSAPNGAMASMPYMQSPDFTQGFVNMANVLKSIAEAKKAGVQTDYLEETAKDNARLIKVQADAAEFQQMLHIKYGDAERLAALLNTKSQTNVNDKNAKVLEKDYDILCEKLHIAKFDREHLWDRYFWEEQKNIVEVGQGQANVENLEADTLVKRAEERLKDALTLTEYKKPEFYEAMTSVQNAIAEFKEFDNKQRSMNKDVIRVDNYASIIYHTKSIRKQYELLCQTLENAIADGDLKAVQFYKEMISTIFPFLQLGVSSLGGASGTAPMGKVGFAP